MEVEIKNHQYHPSTLHIRGKKKATVRWVNRDSVDHTVTALDRSWDSGVIRPQETYSKTFQKRGRYEYFCTIHPHMRGAVELDVKTITNENSSEKQSSEGYDYCQEYREKGFQCEVAEINAIETDLDLISQDLEYAIVIPHREKFHQSHTPPQIRDLVLKNLNGAQKWFDDIVMYINLYSKTRFTQLVEYVRKAQREIDHLKKRVCGVRNMRELQEVSLKHIYGYHGVIGGLRTRVKKEFTQKVT